MNYYAGINIKKLREKFGFKQEELAEKLNVSNQAVSKWENGESAPSIETLIKLSKIFSVSVDYLVTDVFTYEELDSNAQTINFKLRQIYYKYNRNENIGGALNDVIAIILPFYNEDHGSIYWLYNARIILKGTFYAMLEDKNLTAEQFCLETVKEVLQFATIDPKEKMEKIKQYFSNKSKKCKELITVYLSSHIDTAQSMMTYIVTSINILLD